MIMLFLSLVFANPHTIFLNGQRMNEWAPITYDLEARTLVIDDFICDPWMPMPKQNEEKAKASLNSVFFKRTGRFYPVNQMYYYPETKTWIITTWHYLHCDQITIFKDGLE